jgi:uncharacterized C2H2 Zn-finger protein
MRFSITVSDRGAIGKEGTRCPKCDSVMFFSKLMFREGFRCVRCGAVLRVSLDYTRALVLISGLLGFLVTWAAGMTGVRLYLFGIPAGFLILTVMVRFVPYLVTPKLVLRHSSVVTALNLNDGEDGNHED